MSDDIKSLLAEIDSLRQESWVWSKACEAACQTNAALRADCVEAVSMLQELAAKLQRRLERDAKRAKG